MISARNTAKSRLEKEFGEKASISQHPKGSEKHLADIWEHNLQGTRLHKQNKIHAGAEHRATAQKEFTDHFPHLKKHSLDSISKDVLLHHHREYKKKQKAETDQLARDLGV